MFSSSAHQWYADLRRREDPLKVVFFECGWEPDGLSRLVRQPGRFRAVGYAPADSPGCPADLPVWIQDKSVVDDGRHEPYPEDKCLHHLFREQAAKYPQHVRFSWQRPRRCSSCVGSAQTALIDGGQSMTFAEVDLQTDALALYLRSLGAGKGKVGVASPQRSVCGSGVTQARGQVIGILMESSMEYVLAYIAIHKAGAGTPHSISLLQSPHACVDSIGPLCSVHAAGGGLPEQAPHAGAGVVSARLRSHQHPMGQQAP